MNAEAAKAEQPVRLRSGLIRRPHGVLTVEAGRIKLTEYLKGQTLGLHARPRTRLAFDLPLTSLAHVGTPFWRAGLTVLRFDDGSRHVVSFRARPGPELDLSSHELNPLGGLETSEAHGALDLASDTVGWFAAGRGARRARRAWKALLRGKHG